MKFSLMGRPSELGMFYAILGSFFSFFSWEGADIWPQIRLRKIPVVFWSTFEDNAAGPKLSRQNFWDKKYWQNKG